MSLTVVKFLFCLWGSWFLLVKWFNLSDTFPWSTIWFRLIFIDHVPTVHVSRFHLAPSVKRKLHLFVFKCSVAAAPYDSDMTFLFESMSCTFKGIRSGGVLCIIDRMGHHWVLNTFLTFSGNSFNLKVQNGGIIDGPTVMVLLPQSHNSQACLSKSLGTIQNFLLYANRLPALVDCVGCLWSVFVLVL